MRVSQDEGIGIDFPRLDLSLPDPKINSPEGNMGQLKNMLYLVLKPTFAKKLEFLLDMRMSILSHVFFLHPSSTKKDMPGDDGAPHDKG